MFHCSHNKGFTFPELIISVSIILSIFAFAGINLLHIIPDSSLKEASTVFMADAKSQQNAAMLGQSSTAFQIDYSIRIDTNSYTLYKGQVYSGSDPQNYTVQLPSNVTATTTFPDSKITFSAINGEILNFNPSTNQVVFYGIHGKNLIIRFNKLGNIYYVNKI